MKKFRLGLDIDNVITDFDKEVLKEMLIADKTKRNRGIINPNASHMTKGMFDWSKEEVDEFFNNNMERIAGNLKPRRNARKIIDKLTHEGYEIYLISHRAYPHYNHPLETTEKWLKDNKINYHKLILSETPDKTPECINYKIDLMIDDRVSQCIKMNENGINVFVMKTRYNWRDKTNLKVITSWENLYFEVTKWKEKM